MRGFAVFLLALLAELCYAYGPEVHAAVGRHDTNKYRFRAPRKGDRRSACPVLNALANHGYIPRSGRNVSGEQYASGLEKAINFERPIFQGLIDVGLTLSTTGNNNTFHLNDIDKHGAIEHDASLSRNDVFLGDQSSFNPTIWNATKAWFPDPLVTYGHLGRALGQRILAANASNPGFNLTEAQKGVAITASAFVLLLFGNGTEGNADRRQIRVLFEEERLPFKEGYRTPDRPVTAAQVGEAVAKLTEAVPTKLQGIP
ncbi:hypothetical protein MAPG_11885 [Magnaporthiopsis poae ATCC 64411]|uniref:Heme haloperoxidase family profile domain-containing protein n=1 Tax=Magnaporthiopsis poae (strain ATCC 64411 / 73-15) TaxID=644358 RepID=A0A0C4EGE8_MAGP6|nr:hypothetical protein MAPG_11885 [Magnaporthiopsis poae ATCC 64411]